MWVFLWITLCVVCSVSILPKKIAFIPTLDELKLRQVIQNALKIAKLRKTPISAKKGLRVLLSIRRSCFTGCAFECIWASAGLRATRREVKNRDIMGGARRTIAAHVVLFCLYVV